MLNTCFKSKTPCQNFGSPHAKILNYATHVKNLTCPGFFFDPNQIFLDPNGSYFTAYWLPLLGTLQNAIISSTIKFAW